MRILVIFMVFAFAEAGNAQDVTGKWKTIDDNTGEPKSIVNIYNEGNVLYGKVHRILDESKRDQVCTECEGSEKGKPVEGLVIIKRMKKDGNEYSSGTITDPENGKTYKCKIWLDEDNPDILHVRGYIAFLYRTQDWVRAEP